jgi:general nucleoside transport system ATP-binding protein
VSTLIPGAVVAKPVGQNHSPFVLSLKGISKRFGSLLANDDISLDLRRGEIVALLGENGAGKTTLMNILFGHYVADSGSVEVAFSDARLQELSPGSPDASLKAGIGMVHQHFSLADNLTGFENIVLGTASLWRFGFADKGARARLEKLKRSTGLEVDLDRPAAQLSVGERQRVEILKALFRNVRVLVLDEPTAVLTPSEADTLFDTLRALAALGLAIVFISHKLAEVLCVADRIVVLRGGRKVADRSSEGADRMMLAELMVGERVSPPVKTLSKSGAVLLNVSDVSLGSAVQRERLEHVSLQLRAGEIIGIAGVSGNGQAAFANLLSGLAKPQLGTVHVGEKQIETFAPRAMVQTGIGRVPEDLHRDGTIGGMSIAENLITETVRNKANQRWGFLKRENIRLRAEKSISDLDVRCTGPDAPVRLLSGGNMQKVVLARALAGAPCVILAQQPTRGLDVAATADVHKRLLAARDRGAGVVLISDDLDELFLLSDKVAVMHNGRMSQTKPTGETTPQAVGLLMAGQGWQDPNKHDLNKQDPSKQDPSKQDQKMEAKPQVFS